MHQAAPMPPPLPTSVRASSALLFSVAGLALLQAIIELVFVNTDLSVYRDAYRGDTGSGFGSLVSATVGIFFAAVAAILAILNNHGRKNARIATLVLGGLFLLCGGLGSISGDLHRPSRPSGSGALAHVMPMAYGTSVGAADLLTVAAVLAALVLLALPSANRFFSIPRNVAYVYVPVPPAGSAPPPAYPPAPEHPPHTGSIPAIDPWAEAP
ncbi:hypothetical protein [Actinoplanes sp. TFC3]|uniref:hypothetical protein n=1 Tax=Actinoplanes sp. TFC3 TaxID=1710355 RepID=UPI000B010183|nr:hypothetical protein [Actinoplanes sp. TFC3]